MISVLGLCKDHEENEPSWSFLLWLYNATCAMPTKNSNTSGFVARLMECARKKDICTGTKLHRDILKTGLLQSCPYLVSSLITMYAKCGALSEAQCLLQEVVLPDVVSWNALIAGCLRNGQGYDALNCFELMQREGLSPNAITFISVLKACGSTRALNKGKQVHEKLVSQGLLQEDVVLGTALVDMYSKCGAMEQAREMIERLPIRDVVSWNALIAGYVQLGQHHDALNCFEWMQREGVSPDVVTFICIAKAYGRTGNVREADKLYTDILSTGFCKEDKMLGAALIDMFAKCGQVAKAHKVLECLSSRNLASWSALILGYTEQGKGQEAIRCFDQMCNEGLSPDAVTFICILKACGIAGYIDRGQRIHKEIKNRKMLDSSILLGSALVDMYAKCGELAKAQAVLEELHIRDTVCWNALIAGYVQEGQGHNAINTLERMQGEGHSPCDVTFLSLLKACCSTRAVEKGKQIHKEVLSRGMLKKDVAIGNALVDMYAQCGFLIEARQVLQELPVRDIVSWNALISGYAHHDQVHEVLCCFQCMQVDGLHPDNVTYLSILKACSTIGATNNGKRIHEVILKRDLLEKDCMLRNSLMGMYAKTGMLIKALDLLDELHIRDIVSWNTVIAGYAQEGQGHEALRCFEQMKIEGVSPNKVTFLSILTACSHAGLLDEAEGIFTDMRIKYGVCPNLEHHTCMVFVYGCAGLFDKAISVIKAIPSDYSVVWVVLLGACKKWGNIELGKLCFDQMQQLDEISAAAYILILDIFVAAGMKEDAEKVKTMRSKYVSSNKHARNVKFQCPISFISEIEGTY